MAAKIQWTEENIKESVLKYIADNNLKSMPTQKEFISINKLPSISTVAKNFGSITELGNILNIGMKFDWTKEKVNKRVLEYIEINKLTTIPKIEEFKSKNNLPARQTIIKLFGSWELFKISIVSDTIIYKTYKYSDNELLRLLKTFSFLKNQPNNKEIDSNINMPNSKTYRNRFGSLANACKLANIPYTIQQKYTDEELLAKLKKYVDINGPKPLFNLNQAKDLPSIDIYQRRFGSVEQIYNLINIKYDNPRKSYSDDELLNMLKEHTFITGQPNSDEINEAKDLQNYTTYNKRFGALENMCELAGLPYKKTAGVSKGEKEVLEFIKTLTNLDIYENDRTALNNGKELDIYIPDLSLAFEYDGIYWHQEEKVGKNYHIDKTIAAEEEAIKLVHIFSNEWEEKQNIIKSRLTALFGKAKRIYGRKTTIREVTPQESKEFLDKTHLQGNVPASIKLGLIHEEELVAVMTFGKARYQKSVEGTYELIRYSTELNTTIVGGASKLLKYFIRKYKPTNLISYADRRYSNIDNNLYKVLGFEFSHSSNPNYFYTQNGLNLESRVKYQKHKLHKILEEFEPKWSERDNMYYNGFYRIFDSGNLVFKMEVKN